MEYQIPLPLHPPKKQLDTNKTEYGINEPLDIKFSHRCSSILYAHNTQWSTSTMSEREIVGDVSVFQKKEKSFSRHSV